MEKENKDFILSLTATEGGGEGGGAGEQMETEAEINIIEKTTVLQTQGQFIIWHFTPVY